MRKYWVLVGLLLVAGLLFAQNRANYDKKYYEPIKLKPFKTHPNTFVPEEVELEPDLETATKANTETTKPVLTKKDDKKTEIEQELIAGQKEQEAKSDVKSDNSDTVKNQSNKETEIIENTKEIKRPNSHVLYSWYYTDEDAKLEEEEKKSGKKAENKKPDGRTPEMKNGKSKAFKITPVEGVTISAEENALDKDREFTMKGLPESEIEKFSKSFNGNLRETGCILTGWELHAGMSEKEILPGTFKMEFDLDRLGVLPEFYDNVVCYRIDEKGNSFEYIINRNGSKASVESKQNSKILLAVAETVALAYDSQTDEIKIVRNKKDEKFSYLSDYYDVKYDGKVVWKIDYRIASDTFKNDVLFSINAINELSDELLKLYSITKTSSEVSRKIVSDYKSNKYNGSEAVVLRQLQEKYALEAVKTNQNFLAKAKKLTKIYKEYESIAKRVHDSAQLACDYYYNVIYKNDDNLKKVPCVVELVIRDDRKGTDASTPPGGFGTGQWINLPSGLIIDNNDNSYNNLALTIAHEMLHVIQRACYCRFGSNMKWEEAVADFFETDFWIWLKENKNIVVNRIEVNNDFYELYTIPLDSSWGFIEGKFYSYSKSNLANLGYPLSHYVRYVNEREIKEGKTKEEKKARDKRWHALNNVYSWYSVKPGFTTLICDAFNISLDKASDYYIDFAKEYSYKFYKGITAYGDAYINTGKSEAPFLLVGGKETGKNGQRVELEDEDFTIRLRQIRSYASKEYFNNKNNKIAMQIVLDPSFKERLPDRDFKPVGPEQAKETKRGGYFYLPTNPSDSNKNYKNIGEFNTKFFYLLEIDGGRDSSKNASEEERLIQAVKTGYTIWTMYAPELKKENPMDFETVEEIVNGKKEQVEKVRLQLPKKSEAALLGKCIDGYIVKINVDKGEKIERYFEMDKIKEQKVYFDFEELKPKDFEPNEPITGKVSVAEYVLSNNDKKLEGPESEEVEFVLNNSLIIEMVKCPAGSFMMGSSKDELRVIAMEKDEELLHKVTISKPFYIGKYEVTQEQYEKVMKINPSKNKCASAPVDMVTWEDAEKFCEVLNTKFAYTIPEKGYKYALPTEAQWEYACRAGTTSSLNSGKEILVDKAITKNVEIDKKLDKDLAKAGTSDKLIGIIGERKMDNTADLYKNLFNLKSDNLDEVAWYKQNSKRKTHPVGLKKPNAWGIYDMHGNAGEFCGDWYYEYTDKAVTDPVGKKSSDPKLQGRVIRGGSFAEIAMNCRSGFRAFIPENSPHPDFTAYQRKGFGLGFRVVLISKEE